MRIQKKYFLFADFSFVVSGVVALLFSFAITTPTEQFIVGFVICGTGGGFVIYNTWKTILWTSRARRFKKVFGVDPPNFPNGDWKQMSAIQPIVDECLKARAGNLHTVYQAEDRLLGKNPENLEQAMERAKKIMTQAASVESEKKIFWSEQNLACEWGFEVYSDYRSYIEPNSRDEKTKKQF